MAKGTFKKEETPPPTPIGKGQLPMQGYTSNKPGSTTIAPVVTSKDKNAASQVAVGKPSIVRTSPAVSSSQTSPANKTVSPTTNQNPLVQTTSQNVNNTIPQSTTSGGTSLSGNKEWFKNENLKADISSRNTLKREMERAGKPYGTTEGKLLDPNQIQNPNLGKQVLTAGVVGGVAGAGLGIAAGTSTAAIAATALISRLEQLGSKIASGQMMTDKAGKAAMGSSEYLMKASKALSNTRTSQLTASWITKLASGYKNPAMIIGAIAGLSGLWGWGQWAHSESVDGLGIAYGQVVKSGNETLIAEIGAQLDDILDPSLWEQIIQNTPLLGLAKGAVVENLEKNRALKKSNDAVRDKALEEKNKPVEESWFEQMGRYETERKKTRLEEQRQDDERSKILMDNWKKAKDEERTADAEDWAKRIKEEQARQEQKRKEDEEYWRQIQQEKQQAALEKQQADEAYWQKVNKQKEDSGRGTLKFGLL